MSKYRIQEGPGRRAGEKYYRVFIGDKEIGEVYTSRADAEAYIKYLEGKDALEQESPSP